MTRRDLERRVRIRLTSGLLLANGTGAAVVYVFLSYLLPTTTTIDAIDGARQQRLSTVAFVVYLLFTAVVGRLWGRAWTRGSTRWLSADAPPDDAVRAAVQRLPLRLSVVNATLWLGAAVLFGTLSASFALSLGVQVVSTVLLGGVTTVALCYMFAERHLRPVLTLAHEGITTAPPIIFGVTRRVVLAWVVGSGVPLVGIGLGFVSLFPGEPSLSPAGVLFLVGLGLVVGLLATAAAARAVADPVQSVAEALRDVAAGRFGTTVPVYDASEVGQLQAGFNAMSRGLAEREQLRDLFGRQVGTDVARLAMEQGVRLGGERREVAVLFVDVVGSTALAVRAEPEEVVRQLNAFFTVVVDAVARHGGWVNKFEGDAVLCIFGAPAERPDAAACALAAARTLADGLRPLPLEAAIGVGAGPVVAGHVGTESRFEYTVVGDPVNTAARLSELARDRPGRVVADARLLEAAGAEAHEWRPADEVVLRGRSTPTRLAVPRAADS